MAEWAQGWIRLYHEVIIDDKMGVLSDRLWRRAIECMVAAGAEGRGGYLPETKALARKLATNEAELERELAELAAPGVKILEKRPEGWYVVNHLKRQQAKDATGAKRQNDWRQRQQERYDALRNALPNASHNTPRRIEDKEEKKEKATRATPPTPDETLKSLGVVVYREVMNLTPNKEQRRLIYETVTNGDKWRSVLKEWQAHGWNPKNVPGQLEKYTGANGHNGNGQHADRNDAMDDPQIAYLRRLQSEGK